MIPDDEYIMISDITTLLLKGRNMTLAEKEELDSCLEILPQTQGIFDPLTKTTTLFTRDQQLFVKHGLLPLVRNNVPRLTDILALYDLTIDSVFEWKANDYYSGSLY